MWGGKVTIGCGKWSSNGNKNEEFRLKCLKKQLRTIRYGSTFRSESRSSLAAVEAWGSLREWSLLGNPD
jgi:hypothetical protein